MKNEGQQMMRSRFFGYSITFGAGVIQVLAAIILSRVAFGILGEYDLKLWFVMLAILPFITLLEFGANIVFPHHFASVSYEPKRVSPIIASLLCTVLILLSLAFIITLAFCGLAAWKHWLNAGVGRVVVCLALAAGLRVIGNVLQGALYALGDNNVEKIIRLLSTCLMAFVAVVGLKAGLGIITMAIAWAAGAILSIIFSLVRMRSRWAIRILLSEIEIERMKFLLPNSLKYISIALPGQFVGNVIPFIIAANLPAQYSIQYGLTQQMMAGATLLVSIPMTVSLPRLAAECHENLVVATRRILSIVRLAAIIAVVVLVVIGAGRKEILRLWLGKTIDIGPWFIVLYFSAMFIEWQQSAFTTATMAYGKFNFIIVTCASACIVTLGMPRFIHHLGFTGVPVALLVAQGLTCHPHNYYQAFKTFHIHVKEYIYHLRTAIISFIILSIIILLLNFINVTGWTRLLILVVSGTIVGLPPLLVSDGIYWRGGKIGQAEN